jgi:short-subunit dehydrogenase
MFNNAGIAIVGEVRDMNLEHWRRIVDVNLWGVIYGTKAAYSVMVRQGFGHIVNVSSLAGLAPFPSVSSYVATKYAVVGLSTAMRAEGEALGVKISVVCPGFIQTGIHYAGTLLGADREKLLQSIRVKIMDSQKAARIILEGVSRNRAIVVVTPHAHVLWRLYKYFPGIFAILARKGMKDFRAIRSESI